MWRRLLRSLLFAGATLLAAAQSAPPAANPPAGGTAAQHQQEVANTAAAAAVAATRAPPRAPDFLEHLVDSVLELFDVRSNENTVTHYVIAALFLVAALLLRRLVVTLVFSSLKKVAARTKTTLDDKLFPALEAPAGAFVMVVGIFAALSVLKLSENSDRYLAAGSTIAFSLVIFWALLRAFNAVLDHAQEIAFQKKLGVAAFMPWIKKTLVSLFAVLGVLMVVQSLGYDVKALLAGLGIGGLAFALAAQDTLANVFGSIVVAIDQPFKIGEFVQIGANNMGLVEDIGLRSTKLRRPDKSLAVVPNKTVAAEAIFNLSRYTRRRIEQVLSLTYDTTPAQMEALVRDLRTLLAADPEVDKGSVLVFFRDFSASSLDLWLAYEMPNPDYGAHLATRERLNLAFMRAVQRHGLAFAFPTTTLHVATPGAAPDGEPPRAKLTGQGGTPQA